MRLNCSRPCQVANDDGCEENAGGDKCASCRSPPNPAIDALYRARTTRGDCFTALEALKVSRQRGGTFITAVRLLGQALKANRLQVPSHFAVQSRWWHGRL